ncbi:Putative transcriptional regulator [Alloalcanivorax dieselolei B5]|uniref:Putative transcriptional regulator n=1 Tax=Alcanivorax dieselolei (strain DSM 16502 / CGMCC 1.3690 / MCCC 1A00001 / B-5) TaxID=930169 RepID=K0CDE9_ALCDB|nr:AraC family transcriptional regulator [Alloalcanivorax dieselolei]AFT70450.1 Putative transcriptional regulator [Alloalcanivorax dieselolei B5]GGJ84359.1 AraC family transcriptional regulator [Alloalcanivorax dieselolei]
MHVEYATDHLERPRRFEYWHDVVCRHCIPADSRLLSPIPFNGRLSVRDLGSIAISTMVAPLHRWSQEASHLRSHPDEDLWIGFAESGHGVLEQNGHQTPLADGTLVLYDAARPFQCTLEADRVYLVRLPRRALLRRFPQAERGIGQALAPHRPGVAPLRTMIQQAAALEVSDDRTGAAEQFGRALLDLAAVALEWQGEFLDGAVENDLHARLCRFIEAHFEDPSLSLVALAHAHHVSPRTVTRAFARHDQTAMGMVWHVRLQASRRALEEGRVASVTEAAFHHGFTDVSHFSRAFRRAFGRAPHTLLRPGPQERH